MGTECTDATGHSCIQLAANPYRNRSIRYQQISVSVQTHVTNLDKGQ